MLILSFRSAKFRIFALIAAAAICIGGAATVVLTRRAQATQVKQPESVRGANAQERLEFLTSLGWEADAEPVEVAEIIIPAEFDEVYTEYNELQKEQGFDLEVYCGLRVKRWTYRITNLEGYPETSDCIRANLLVYDGIIIGGDICSVELDGFMKGLVSREQLKSA